jgi:membrane fusion protein, multidrug efflux system
MKYMSFRFKMAIVGFALIFTASCIAGGLLARENEVTGSKPLEGVAIQGRPAKLAIALPVSSGHYTSYPGSIQPAKKADLHFRVSGPLVAVNVQVGDEVTTGQVLMKIDPRDFERRVNLVKNQVDNLQAEYLAMIHGDRSEDIQMLEADLVAAQARDKETTSHFKRMETLLASQVQSRNEYDRAERDMQVSQAAVKRLNANLEKARKGAREEDLAAMKAQIATLETELKVAEDQLADCQLGAPFGGVVTRQCIENFEMVQGGVPVLRIHDISTLEISVSVPESVILSQNFDRMVPYEVQLSSLPDVKIPAFLKEWNTEAELSTKTFDLVFSLKAPTGIKVFPGMTAEVSGPFAEVSQGSASVYVPSGAVVSTDQGKSSVWVYNLINETIEKRPVVMEGTLGDAYVGINAGLKPGEVVVASGANFLSENMKVIPLNAEEIKSYLP